MEAEKFLKKAAIASTALLAVEAGVLYAATTPTNSKPDLPGVYERKPQPAPVPKPELSYGVDPLGGRCSTDSSSTVEDDNIILQDGVENKIAIGGIPFAYNVRNESLVVVPSLPGDKGFTSTVVTIDNSDSRHKDNDARQYTVKLGESVDLAPPGAIPLQDFLSYPKASHLQIIGSCINKVSSVVKDILHKNNS
ncbi:MAG TPA: hypothetical protein VHE53_01025 [Patescibacteria group bacterium]|nr:hypothetical protein [Patescibacteria group bacterium]